MANLAFHSIVVLGLVFGGILCASYAVASFFGLSIAPAFESTAFTMLVLYILGPRMVELVYRIRWIEPEKLGKTAASFLKQSCSAKKIPLPRTGLVEDANPNALTFGRHRGDARLVLTRGLLDSLDEEELMTVLGHELGHIAHLDFVIMTLAASFPVLLYMLSDLLARDRNCVTARCRGAVSLIGRVALIIYIVCEYMVLFFSRAREYRADRFSADLCRNPGALVRALVKIAHGQARPPAEGEVKDTAKAVAGRVFGIFDPKTAQGLALDLAARGSSSPEDITHAMNWEIRNPWAMLYEMSSSHPLPSRRIIRLEGTGNMKPERFSLAFLIDLAFNLLPWTGMMCGTGVTLYLHRYIGLPFLLWGLGYLLKLLYAYPRRDFLPSKTPALPDLTAVSGIRAYPVELEGEIAQGQSLLSPFSTNLIIKDESGSCAMVFRQPLPLWDFLFGPSGVSDLLGKKSLVRGWLRRPYGPYLEAREILPEDGGKIKNYFLLFQITLSVLLIATGLAILGLELSAGGLTP